MEFATTLDMILSEGETSHTTPLETAMQLVRKLDSAKQLVLDLQHQLMSTKNRMNADLALAIKRQMPALNVGIDKNGCCKIGYKTKHLLFSPDLDNRIWTAQSPDLRFANKFNKRRRRDLLMNHDMQSLLDAITHHFVDHYRSLGEDLIGNGLIMVEGKIGSLADLVRWREDVSPPIKRINSRATRQQCSIIN